MMYDAIKSGMSDVKVSSLVKNHQDYYPWVVGY